MQAPHGGLAWPCLPSPAVQGPLALTLPGPLTPLQGQQSGGSCPAQKGRAQLLILVLSAATSAKSCNLAPAQRSREGPAACLQQRSYAAVKPFKGPFHELQPASTSGGGKQGEPGAHESCSLLPSPNLCFLPGLGRSCRSLQGIELPHSM